MSCPDLRPEPYTVEKLEEQLKEQTQTFLSQTGKGFQVVGPGEIKLSPIFDWFAEDFASEGGVEHYVQAYLPTSDTPWKVVGYLNYNWDVNCHITAQDKQEILQRKRHALFN